MEITKLHKHINIFQNSKSLGHTNAQIKEYDSNYTKETCIIFSIDQHKTIKNTETSQDIQITSVIR
jgi:hypothetical protein